MAKKAGKALPEMVFEAPGKLGWLWWFWLFFWDCGKEKPKQLMFLWSAKNDRRISCNSQEWNFKRDLVKEAKGGFELDGAVASWFFDGKKMRHDFVLGQERLFLGKNRLSSKSCSMKLERGKSKKEFFETVIPGKKMRFLVHPGKSLGTSISKRANKFLSFGYEITRFNSGKLTGVVQGKKIGGTAYFQRVLVSGPAVPWHWGIFHFADGSVLSYFKPVLGLSALGKTFAGKGFDKSVKKHAMFWHAPTRQLFEFNEVKVKTIEKKSGKTKQGSFLPIFLVEAKDNRGRKLSFEVRSYSQSHWRFRKKGLLKQDFTYGEYPSEIKNMVLELGGVGERVTQKTLGRGIGNAEHSWGLLL
jgi:hypothetical protein